MSQQTRRRSTPAADTVLSVSNLSTRFFTEEGQINAVESVSFDLRDNEILGIGGESGSGDWVAGGFKRIAAYWGHRFGVPPGELSSLEVAVEGVTSLETYAAVESAMAGISSIETVRLAGLSGGSARFRLRFQGRPVDLKQTLSLNQAFRPLGDSAEAGEQLLRFEYQP